jgi:hypothetical protein
VTEEPRSPVAIRSLRPYDTEDEFLAEECDTLSRTAVTLIGAPSRPRGVVIRFELTLRDGSPLVRGEGRVLAFEPADEYGPSSLTLRFTRLDARSKALVDRAAALREANASGTSSSSAASADSGDQDPLATTQLGEIARPGSDPTLSEEPIALSTSSAAFPLGDVEEIGAHAEVPVRAAAPSAPVWREDAKLSLPTDLARRDSLLERLRERAKTLSPAQVATILTVPRPSSS